MIYVRCYNIIHACTRFTAAMYCNNIMHLHHILPACVSYLSIFVDFTLDGTFLLLLSSFGVSARSVYKLTLCMVHVTRNLNLSSEFRGLLSWKSVDVFENFCKTYVSSLQNVRKMFVECF